MEKNSWHCIMKDGTVIHQYPDETTDNTLLFGKEIMPNYPDVREFSVSSVCESGLMNLIGINFEERYFVVGDQSFPFLADALPKLVYFITRTVIANEDDGSDGIEQPKVFTVGFEDSNGKLFLNLEEGSGAFAFSTSNP